MIVGNGDYFTIDTYPDTYENIDDNMKALLLPDIQKNALEAIRACPWKNDLILFAAYGRQTLAEGFLTV